jgi:hypothetical protein
MMRDTDRMTFDCLLVDESRKAYKVKLSVLGRTKTLWVGKSLGEVVHGSMGARITVPRWLAEREGMA